MQGTCSQKPGTTTVDRKTSSAKMGKPTWNPKVLFHREVHDLLEQCLGSERLERISSSLPKPPLKLSVRVNTLKATGEEVLEELKNDLSNNLTNNPYIHPELPIAIIVPGSGPHEVEYGETEGREIIVGRLAGEAMLKGAHGYAPGILASTRGILKGDLIAVSIGLEVEGAKYGVSRGHIMSPHVPLDDPRFPDRKNLFIGTGIANVSRGGIDPSGKGLVVEMKDRVFSLPSLRDSVADGKAMVQNFPSIVAAATLDPTPGATVLDMCAAPGGKTTALAQMMKNHGKIYAFDRSHNKAAHVEKLCEEMGITIVKALKADATKIFEEGKTFQIETNKRELSAGEKRVAERKAAAKWKRGKSDASPPRVQTIRSGFDSEYFDYVLLDAPCSAMGLRPRISFPMNLKYLMDTALYQKKFIDTAVHLVKKGGFMVFSTCTISPLENECNVRYIIDTYPFMKLVPSKYHFGGPGLQGDIDIQGKTYQLLSKDEAPLVQRFDPDSGGLDTMGFFIAKFERMK